MNWYYAAGGEKASPFTDENFASLVALGVVKGDTMVWHEGLVGWQAYREIAAPSEVAPESPGVMVACAQCGRSVLPAELTQWEGRRVCPDCAPVAAGATRAKLTGAKAEIIRKEYLKHEAAVKYIGILYLFMGGICVLPAIGSLLAAFRASSTTSKSLVFGGCFMFMLVIALLAISLGNGIRRLRPWARRPLGILSVFGLFGFPFGTLLNGYILYLVFSEKGRMVFSESYHEVIAATPHVKYKTSIVAWILIGLVVLLMLLQVMGAMLGWSRH